MRTKTLILTAAATMVSAAVMAQVTSVNVVGYVNKSLPLGWTILVNPLDITTGNTVAAVLPGANLLEGTTIYKWNPTSQSYDFTATTSFGDWDDTTGVNTVKLNPGEGFWLNSPAAQTITFVGDVKQGTLTTPIGIGYSLVGSQVPQEGKLQTDLAFAPTEGDTIYWYNNPPLPAGDWATVSFTFGAWDPFEPTNKIAEALFVFRTDAGSPWTRTFTVAP